MLVVETVGRIRREHLVNGKSIKEIARDLKISRNTVRKVLRSGATSFEYEREVQPRPKLGRWSGDLDRLLLLNSHAHLPEFDGGWLRPSVDRPRTPPPNLQDPVAFAEQSARITAATPALRWLRPSDGDPDRRPDVRDAGVDGVGDTDDRAAVAGGGRVRGLVLHKLLEELLTGQLAETPEAVLGRAADLLAQLADGMGAELLPDVSELTRTCLATLTLPAVVAARPRMIAECAVRSVLPSDGARRLVDGRADAVQLGPAGVEAVFDWKSDVDPSPAEIAAHRDQMRIYLAATGAPRGLVVYVTSGRVDQVEAPYSADAKPSEADS